MNCKKGDLAIIVRSDDSKNIGQIMLVVRRYDGNPFSEYGPAWWCEYKGVLYHVCDSDLRPIRDNDGEDEMLRIVGKPEGVTA